MNRCDDPRRFDLDAIRGANPLPDYCRAAGIELRGSGNPRGCCPIHGGDNRGAFSIFQRDGVWRWHCHTGDCGGGDVIELHRRLHGLTFRAACLELGGQASEALRSLPKHQPAPMPPMSLPELPPERAAEKAAIAARLGNDSALIQRIAESRRFKPDAIASLARDGTLGWLESVWNEGPWLAFIFPHAVKIRRLFEQSGRLSWHEVRNGKLSKTVRWLWTGWPWNHVELWRERETLSAEVLLLTEGEPDALRLLSLGLEGQRRAVASIPDSSLSEDCPLCRRLGKIVAGKSLAVFADDDNAGARAVKVLAPILKRHSSRFRVIEHKKLIQTDLVTNEK